MNISTQRIKSSVIWNLSLITAGAFIFSLGLKSIAIPHGFITGGISGLGLLVFYVSDVLSPGAWYLIINIPLFLIGWIFISRRFFFYSLYGMISVSTLMDMIKFQIDIKDPFLAFLTCGFLLGAGSGITLHSLGSLGGTDILGIIAHKKLSIRMGSFFFLFNVILFVFSFGALNTEVVLYSIAMSFITSQVIDFVLTMFNQRKMILIISELNEEIAQIIKERLNRGATFINGEGAYTGKNKKIILTVVHNYQLKRLEEAVLQIDPNAFMITENTFDVMGRGFSKPKIY